MGGGGRLGRRRGGRGAQEGEGASHQAPQHREVNKQSTKKATKQTHQTIHPTWVGGPRHLCGRYVDVVQARRERRLGAQLGGGRSHRGAGGSPAVGDVLSYDLWGAGEEADRLQARTAPAHCASRPDRAQWFGGEKGVRTPPLPGASGATSSLARAPPGIPQTPDRVPRPGGPSPRTLGWPSRQAAAAAASCLAG